jgi:Flp pilus assembly protein TadG
VIKLLRSTCIPFRALPAPRRFLEEEDGAITAMTLILFLVMIVAAGVTWDMMRSEADRVHLQGTLDRAVIAAAPLDEERDAREVVEDYLRAAGIDPADVRVQTFDEPHATRVSARATSSVDSMFLNLLGEDLIEVSVESEAREEKWHLEVSLVLDTSSSMDDEKQTALEEAAIEFANEVLTTAAEEGVRATISIVVYQDVVNLGPEVASWFDLTQEHTHSYCVVFPADAYKTVGIDAGTVLQRVAHFDRRERWTNDKGIIRQSVCPTDDDGNKDRILPWSRDIEEITTFIRSLEAADGTATSLGVKWGAALLDPSMRDHAQKLVDARVSGLNDDYTGMPMNYEGDTRKVLVVMTDGASNDQRDVYPDRKDGPSGVFVSRPGLEVPIAAGHAAPYGIDDVDGRSYWTEDWKDAGNHSKTAQADWIARGGKYAGDAWWTDADRRDWVEFDEHNDVIYSIWSRERQQFWVKNPESDRRKGTTGSWQSEPEGGTSAIELTFAEFYGTVPVHPDNPFWWDKHYGNAGGAKPFHAGTRNFYTLYAHDGVSSLQSTQPLTNQRQKDAQKAAQEVELDGYLQDICQAARDEGILIFTIAFQAGDWGSRAMRECAGLENRRRYFPVNDLDIGSAFDDVWGSIEKLKLTQ